MKRVKGKGKGLFSLSASILNNSCVVNVWRLQDNNENASSTEKRDQLFLFLG